MIIWLASYPRSGNTFLRIVLNSRYGVPTYVVYDVDGVARRIGPELMDARHRPTDLREMDESRDLYFVKTHRRRTDERRAICLVRDGRDAVVSWARLRAEERNSTFEEQLPGIIAPAERTGTGDWGGNVLSWLALPPSRRSLVRYEDLIADPAGTVRRALAHLAVDLPPTECTTVPTFGELQRLDGTFFRRGAVGSHRDELPADLHELFWAQPDNAATMAALGYHR
jgi:hypothetical protein